MLFYFFKLITLTMKLPTEQQCLDYFAEYKVPKNIFSHCVKVREVSVFLSQN